MGDATSQQQRTGAPNAGLIGPDTAYAARAASSSRMPSWARAASTSPIWLRWSRSSRRRTFLGSIPRARPRPAMVAGRAEGFVRQSRTRSKRAHDPKAGNGRKNQENRLYKPENLVIMMWTAAR